MAHPDRPDGPQNPHDLGLTSEFVRIDDRFPNSEGQDLSYSLFTPDTSLKRPHPAVLFLHGAAQEHSNGRVWFNGVQEVLAKNGIASFAFDVRGVGQSDGEYYDSTLEHRLADARDACAFFTQHRYVDPNRVFVVGLSMGGHIASRLAGGSPEDYRGLVEINGAVYRRDAESARLKPYDEFTIAIREEGAWRDSFAFEDLARYPGPVLFFDSARDDVVPMEVKATNRASVQNLEGVIMLPVQKHAFFSGQDEESAHARDLFGRELTDFIKKYT